MATPTTDQPHEDWLNVLNDIWENEQQLQTRQGQSSSSSSASQGSHRWTYSNSASSDQEQVLYNSTANPTTNQQTPSTSAVIGSSVPANTNESSVTPKNPPDTESNNSHSQNNNSTMATNNNSIPTEDKVLARSERKRSREKQRRLDVNSQFQVLTSLLRQIETEDLGTSVPDAATSTTAAGIVHNSTINVTNATNRVDLIARTVSVLERLHELNVTRKREISDLKEKLDATKKTVEQVMLQHKEAALFQPPKQDKVMMMVPMMVSSDTLAGAGGLGGCNMARMSGMGGMGFPMTAAHAAFMPQSFFPQNPMTAPQQQQQQQHPQQQPQQQQQQQQHPQQQQTPAPAPAPVGMQPLMVAPTAAQTLQPISAMMAAQQMGYPMAQPQQNMTQYSHSQNPSSHLTQQQPQSMYSHEPQQPQPQQNNFEQYVSSMPIPINMPFSLPPVTSTASTTPPLPLTTPPPQQQGSDPQSPSSQSAPNVGGGNLAHCA